jgi:serine/threonine-protein kinase
VLFESLTGARPFAGETVSDTLARILERDPDFGILPAATPARVRELLQRCLEKDARRRLRDIGDARLTLEDVLATRSPSGRLVLYDAGPRTGASPAGSKWVPVIAAAVGLALGAALWHWFGLAAAGGAEETSCVSVGMPPDVSVQQVWLTNDGQTVVVLAQPSSPPGAAPAPPRIYTRRLDRFEFKELPGTEGTLGFSVATDDRSLLVLAPTSSVSSQIRLAKIPLDGSAPATTLTEFEHTWSGAPLRMDNGDLLFLDRGDSFVRVPAAGGNPSPPMRMDAGRSGVSNYALSWPLPGDRAILVDVVAYDARGWHYSVGVMDVHTGKVKVIEEDGGSARYSPTGHLVFARGDAILAAPFDLGRLEPVGAPIAVWSGLSARFIFTPGIFNLARNGSLFYRPGQAGGERSFATLDASGKLVPWSAERRAVDAPPEISPDGRRLACTIPNSRGIDEIWTSPIDSPGFQRLGTDPGADASAPVWSPDSKRIAYLRVGKNSRDGIYVQDAEGGEARLIFKVDDWLPRSWLTDGSMLIVKRGPSGSSLKLLKIDGEPTDSTRLRPLLTSEFNLFEARVSPDGRHIAVLSDESGPISAYMAELRPDGSTSRPVQLKSETAIRWASDGSALYLRDDHNRILRCPVSLAAPTEVCDLDKLGIAMWSVLRDGRLLMGLKNDNETQITHYNLVLNWTKELERKLKAAR